ncbi:MAG: MOSC domain-containing protein [Gemmatimonadota bacterium]
MGAPRLAGIFVHPVKSTRRIEVETAELDECGLVLDRRWMLADPEGRAVTQRERPALARVRTRVAGDRIVVSAPDREDLVLPARPVPGGEVRVEVWDDRFSARLVEGPGSAWFSEHLGTPCRLVWMSDDLVRPVDARHGRDGDRVAFTDGYPLLLIGRASLDDLNSRLDVPVPMDRFRPNLVVEGSEPFAEDGWARVRIGQATFRVAKSCARCSVTTIDQATGEKGPEPLRTLATYRKRNGKVLFGQYLLHDAPGWLRTGDPVDVLEIR